MIDADRPRELGKYRIEGVLGRGAMGIVFRAFDPRLERHVAIKTIRTELFDGRNKEDWLERFSREARAAARCAHANIVVVHDFDIIDDQPFIVMELVRGRQLSDYLNDGHKFEQPTIRSIMRQTLAALACAHEAGLVHRDIKPANIILSDGHQVKVADFGVARIDDSHMTSAGSVIGTPQYMAPEQLLGEAIDHRADLFASAIILFELLTGERPFKGRSTTELMFQITQGKPRDITELAPDLPASIREVVMRALARDPDDRYENAAAFAAALERSIGTGEVTQVTTETLISEGSFEPSADDVGTMVEDFAKAELEIAQKLEAELATTIGPIAKVLVRRAAARSTSLEEMYETLAGHIPNPEEAARFRERSKTILTASGSTTGMRSRSRSYSGIRQPIADSEIEAARAALLPYLGPIANVLARKHAKSAHSLEDYWHGLAEQIPSDAERQAFLDEAPN